MREWHAAEDDWRKTRDLIGANYGYDKFRGNCHMVPNHALIIHALLHGDDDFRRSLMIVNTGGWDTDCNSGNVGCILGIKNGLATFAGADDWRVPVADRLYLSTAEGGRGISDAAIETIRVVNAGRALKGEAADRAEGRRPLPLLLARLGPGLPGGRPRPGDRRERCPEQRRAGPGDHPDRLRHGDGHHPDLHPRRSDQHEGVRALRLPDALPRPAGDGDRRGRGTTATPSPPRWSCGSTARTTNWSRSRDRDRPSRPASPPP